MESDQTPQYRNLTPKELDELTEHKVWLGTKGVKGIQADFTGRDFKKVDFSKAPLVRASFYDAVLNQANFEDADLTQANLKGAQLDHTNLRSANLQDADLTDAKGLFAKQLAGANVSGAKLPKDIHDFKGLDHVKELSQRAQKLFLTLLGGCVYCWLTIGTTTDLGLVTDSVSSPLPIIGTNIRISGFYLAAPFLLFAIYLWFHLYLQHLWKGLSHLPAIFPDGRALDEKVDPWLVNGLVRAHIPRLKMHRPFLSKLQVGLSIILVWWVVPCTLVFLWERFLTKHTWWITALHILLIAGSVWSGILFYKLAKLTLKGQEPLPEKRKAFVTQVLNYKKGLVQVGIAVLFVLSMGAIFSTYEATPKWFGYLGLSPFADLSELNISQKPQGSWPESKEKQNKLMAQVRGVNLKEQNLRFANFKAAFLVKANLRSGQLQKANLSGAQLQKADLSGAQLQGADLSEAQLQQARLAGAQLQRTELRNASLQKAILNDAQLEKTILVRAQLQEATLLRTQLQEADLELAQLQNADLRRAQLQNANLRGAQLQNANLEGAQLEKANFHNADLTKSKGLTQEQLNTACVSITTKLPPELSHPEFTSECKNKWHPKNSVQ